MRRQCIATAWLCTLLVFAFATDLHAANNYTITATAGSGGSISPSGAVVVKSGGSQTFTITPDTGYHVADVAVDSVSQGAITTYPFTNVRANHTIAATFAINTYTITATAGSGGSISPSGAVVVNYGGSQIFTITPNTGYHVANVTVDGVSQGPITSYTFSNVTANHMVVASFAINTYTITATAGSNGTVTPPTVTANYGDNQTFTITPNAGYHVADVTVDGASQGAIASYTFTNITANHTIAATFAINTYTITAAAGSGGTVTPATATVNYGSSQTFTITPNTGYHVADVTVDGISQGATTSYTFPNVTANHAIAASFAINAYTITATAGSGGTVTPATATVNSGGSQSITITPNAGYNIADVTVDGVSQGAITSYTFTNITADHTIQATFVANTITVTIDSPSDGATINRPDVMVTGTATNAGGYETGVTVNGVVANVYGNQFAANHVPLQDGPNVITVTATDAYGTTSTASVTVTAVTTGTYIWLTTDTQSGVAPLLAALQIDGSFSIATSSISATGPLQPDVVTLSADQYQVNMTAEGMYFLTANVTGPDQNRYQDTIAIAALNKDQVNALLKNKWDSMKAAFVVNDVPKAVSHFADDSVERYSAIFAAIGSDLHQLAQDMQDIELVYIQGGIAQYRIKRIEDAGEITYYIDFIQDDKGLWKIHQF
ncbi:MAG TPA: hypothetical protein VI298_17250 [Geobacteraceae bacterium]